MLKQLLDHESYGFTGRYSLYAYLLLIGLLYPVIIFALPEFKDYQNYLEHVERSGLLLANFGVLLLSASPAAFLAEPLWFSFLFLLQLLFEAPFVLGLVLSFSLVLTSLAISRMNKTPWITLFLILIFYPLATKYFMQFRQGFAIGLYLLGYNINGPKGIMIRLCTPLVHSSMFLLLAIEAAYHFFKHLYLSKRLLITFSSTIAIITILAIPSLINIANAQGLVSDTFTLEAPAISGVGVLLWSLFGTVFFLLSRPSKEVALGLTGILVFIFSQFYIDIGSRFIPIFLPFIIASFNYESIKKQALIVITLVFGLVLWLPTIFDPGRVFG